MSNKNKLLDISNCIKTVLDTDKTSNNKIISVINKFLSLKNDIHENILLTNLYGLINKAELLKDDDIKVIFKENKNIKYKTNNIKFIQKQIGKGSYGKVNSCVFNGVICAVKCPKYDVRKEFSEYYDDYYNEYIDNINFNFLKENLVHLLLFCFFDLMSDCLKLQMPQFIPQIHNLVIATSPYKFDGYMETLIVVMEKFDCSISNFLEKKKSYKDELYSIALVAYNIYFLQKCFKMIIHGDLHGENVMIRKLMKNKKYTIKTKKDEFEILCDYQIFIIDFGKCSVNFSSNCANIKMPKSKISAETYHTVNNKSQDLRLFLAYLYYVCNISNDLKSKLKKYFIKYEKNKIFRNYEENGCPHHYFYDDVIENIDSNFFPEAVINFVGNEINKI